MMEKIEIKMDLKWLHTLFTQDINTHACTNDWINLDMNKCIKYE